MSSDYSKKKNVELEELLKARSLPHTGKKADLVARLQQYDKDHPQSGTKPVNSKPSTAVADDEIDWDDDAIGLDAPASATQKPSEPSAAALAAGGQGQVPNPTAVPNQVIDTDPSTTSDLKATGNTDAPAVTDDAEAKPAEPTPAPAPPPPADFTKGLSTTSIDTEIEKRKTRAARFGIQESNDDALKALERAKRFGTGSKEEKVAVKGLDTALPERSVAAGKKRGRGGDLGEGERPGKRAESGNRADGGRRDGRPSRRRGAGVEKNGNGSGNGAKGGRGGNKGASTANDKDRLAAEARKKRFAAAT